ncbi:MAG TPA: AraC family transcriptional regulator [Blastocatellia bacterium]|nr:AraC family transcriptional regulator [Blastocatellia bacterium]
MSSQTVLHVTRSPLSSGAALPAEAAWFRLRLLSDPAGVTEYPASRGTAVSIHVGPSVHIACTRGSYRHSGTAVHGDIDIIPAGTASRWEMKERDTALALILSDNLLETAAEELNICADRAQIRNRFQIRDPQLENIGWALKAEMEACYPSGRLYLDSLAMSVASRLIQHYSSASVEQRKVTGRLTDRRVRQVISYVEDNLNRDISLADIAAVTGLSVSHFKTLFRESFGLPVHQYLIRRRVDRAKTLLAESNLPISAIALEAGFAHQSHLAQHMRRILGISPSALRATLADEVGARARAR